MNIENLILVGLSAKDNINKKVVSHSGSMTFENGIFFSFKLKVAFFQSDTLFILNYTAGGQNFVSNYTSQHINKLKKLCIMCNIDSTLEKPEDYSEEDLS